MGSTRSPEGRERNGIESSSNGSTSAGTTCAIEGACRLLAEGVDIRIIQLMLGHASIQQTQRYLNVTDEELRRGLEVSWNNKGRQLRLASGS
jgi:integrase